MQQRRGARRRGAEWRRRMCVSQAAGSTEHEASERMRRRGHWSLIDLCSSSDRRRVAHAIVAEGAALATRRKRSARSRRRRRGGWSGQALGTVSFIRVLCLVSLSLQLVGRLLLPLLLLLLLDYSSSSHSLLVRQSEHAIGLTDRRHRLMFLLLLVLLCFRFDARKSSIHVSASIAPNALPALILARCIVVLGHVAALAWAHILVHVDQTFAETLQIEAIMIDR